MIPAIDLTISAPENSSNNAMIKTKMKKKNTSIEDVYRGNVTAINTERFRLKFDKACSSDQVEMIVIGS